MATGLRLMFWLLLSSAALGAPDAAVAAQPKAPAATAKTGTRAAMTSPAVTYRAVSYADLPGWAADDHAAALSAFHKSCGRVLAALRAGSLTPRTMTAPQLLAACSDAARLLARKPDRAAARALFEQHFVAHRVMHAGSDGLFTAYYEPVYEGSRKQAGPYRVPVYRRPPDLVTLIEETAGSARPDAPTHARRTAGGLKPFPTRQQIDEGALENLGLELVYLKDGVDLFFMQLQGSGRIRLAEGGIIRVTYDGKNGHPYTSIGRHLIDNGILAADKVSLDGLAHWLRADRERGRKVMWQNAAYVFFRELIGKDADSAHGVLNIPLTPGRSLAVDASVHSLGLPMFVSAPTLTHIDGGRSFNRLMIAQDVGGAIRGAERGDLFLGSGPTVGKLAGITKHAGNLFVLLPVGADAETPQPAPPQAAGGRRPIP